MRSLSYIRIACIALFATAAFLSLTSSLRAGWITVNPLVNPGGELGDATGWSGNVSVVSGSRTFSGKTLKATEGSYYFTHEGTSTWAGHTYNYSPFWMEQTIDVSAFSAISSISYSADFQASGNGYDFSYDICSTFYDKAGNRLGSDYPWDYTRYSTGSQTISRTASSIPTEVATIILQVSVCSMAVNSGDNLIGVDNIKMTISGYDGGVVPEPSSIIMLGMIALSSGVYWLRRK